MSEIYLLNSDGKPKPKPFFFTGTRFFSEIFLLTAGNVCIARSILHNTANAPPKLCPLHLISAGSCDNSLRIVRCMNSRTAEYASLYMCVYNNMHELVRQIKHTVNLYISIFQTVYVQTIYISTCGARVVQVPVPTRILCVHTAAPCSSDQGCARP